MKKQKQRKPFWLKALFILVLFLVTVVPVQASPLAEVFSFGRFFDGFGEVELMGDVENENQSSSFPLKCTPINDEGKIECEINFSNTDFEVNNVTIPEKIKNVSEKKFISIFSKSKEKIKSHYETKSGYPNLPFFNIEVVSPKEYVIDSSKIKIFHKTEKIILPNPDNLKVIPIQQLITTKDIKKNLEESWVEPDENIYNLSEYIPEVENVLIQQQRSYQLTMISFSPFIYNPLEGKIEIVKNITIELN